MKALTSRQREILDFMEHYLETRKVPPTLREIASFLNLKSPSTVYRHLQRIAKKGYLLLRGGHRGWVLVRPFREGVRVPVYRELPLPPQRPLLEPVQEWIELPEWMIQDLKTPEALFAIRWSIFSPESLAVQPGDLVIVHAHEVSPQSESWVMLYLPEQGVVLGQVVSSHPNGMEVRLLAPFLSTKPKFYRTPILLGRVVCILRFPS